MTSPGDYEARLTAVEREVALARADAEAARTLAAGADRDVSEVRAELRAHTQSLNALRQTQVEQGQQLVGLKAKVDDMDQRMTQGFATLGEGMAQIHALLSRIAPED